MEDLLTLYPNCEPYNFDFLSKNGHKIYYEECGNPDGKPAIFLHGGPGGGGSTQVKFSESDTHQVIEPRSSADQDIENLMNKAKL